MLAHSGEVFLPKDDEAGVFELVLANLVLRVQFGVFSQNFSHATQHLIHGNLVVGVHGVALSEEVERLGGQVT